MAVNCRRSGLDAQLLLELLIAEEECRRTKFDFRMSLCPTEGHKQDRTHSFLTPLTASETQRATDLEKYDRALINLANLMLGCATRH